MHILTLQAKKKKQNNKKNKIKVRKETKDTKETNDDDFKEKDAAKERLIKKILKHQIAKIIYCFLDWSSQRRMKNY